MVNPQRNYVLKNQKINNQRDKFNFNNYKNNNLIKVNKINSN